MFNQIVMHNALENGKFDAGLLAETMLFYEDVILMLERGAILQLTKDIDAEYLVELIDNYGLKIAFQQNNFATLTHEINGIKTHRFAAFRTSAVEHGRRKINKPADELQYLLEKSIGTNRKARRIIKKIHDKASYPIVTDSEHREIVAAAMEQLRNPESLNFLLRTSIEVLCPGARVDPRWHIDAVPFGEEFGMNCVADFPYLTKFFATHVEDMGELKPEYIITYLSTSVALGYMASRYMASFVTDPLNSALFTRRFNLLARRRQADIEQLNLFQEHHVQARRIRDVINAGDRSMKDFIELLAKARKFRRWLADMNPDAKLLSEYYREATKDSWVNGLPVKSLRWVIAGAIGLATSHPAAGVAASVATSAVDDLLFGRLLKGWRPHQFVEGPLNHFLSP